MQEVCIYVEETRKIDAIKGTVSQKLTPMLLCIVRKLSLQGLAADHKIVKNLKGLLCKLDLNISAFTRYFTCKGPASFQVCNTPEPTLGDPGKNVI